MPAIETLYPPAPAGIPPEITRPDAAYRGRVLAMIGGLLLFLVVYVLLIGAAAFLTYWLVMFPMEAKGRGGFYFLLFKFGGAAAAAMLCLFLVKGLFKGNRVQRSSYLQLKPADHPELFAFIRRVYEDTGAPAPRSVYVSPDVNAALVYDSSVLSLIIPPRKDLLIGLGVVNVVNLAEFKAVLAHEFGHFAQRSVGLGSYLYVANRVMNDIVYGRDGLDRLVDMWASIDIRISFPAWGLKGVLWLVRAGLGAIYRSLNLLHLSLGRQMEYNADNVAVSVTGSDAIVHGLARLEFANEALADAAHSLNAAADHGLLTDDLYLHHTRSAERLRRMRKNDRLGLPPELPADPSEIVWAFPEQDDGIPEQYRSHPADYMRERNAKRFYVRSPLDDRSPWLLFRDTEKLKREVTAAFYEHALGRRERYDPKPAAEVQGFIDAEHAETTFDPKYHGLYDDRFVMPGDAPGLTWPAERVSEWLTQWPPADLETRVGAYRVRQSEFNLLHGLKSGELGLKGKTFTFRQQECTARDVNRLFEQVDAELGQDQEGFYRLDRECFSAHWSLARLLDGESGPRAAELRERYQFHTSLQELLKTMLAQSNHLQSIVQFLTGNQQLDEDSFREVRHGLQAIHGAILDCLRKAERLRTPALTNVPAGSPLLDLVMDRGDTKLTALDDAEISGEWIGKLYARAEGVLSRVKRVHFKSLGSLLAFQEKLAAEWRQRSQDEIIIVDT